MLLENMKINYNPLVLFNTLFNIVSYDTKIKGYWIDENGKVYIDNIELQNYPIIRNLEFLNAIKVLFSIGEKCVFYKDVYNQGVLRFPNRKWKVLKNRIAWLENKKPSQKYIKALLNQHSGLTIYNMWEEKYLIEIYK